VALNLGDLTRGSCTRFNGACGYSLGFKMSLVFL
jgi:hypothetical protein